MPLISGNVLKLTHAVPSSNPYAKCLHSCALYQRSWTANVISRTPGCQQDQDPFPCGTLYDVRIRVLQGGPSVSSTTHQLHGPNDSDDERFFGAKSNHEFWEFGVQNQANPHAFQGHAEFAD